MYDQHFWIITYDAATYWMPNPGNQAVTVGESSNGQTIKLFDGSKARLTPQVQSNKDPFSFEITEASARESDYTQLKYFQDNTTRCTLTTHVDESFIGYFQNVKKIYTLSGKVQRYTIRATFIPED
jgi:hypothetical protein